jgi:uroporphyrinogen-III synthase
MRAILTRPEPQCSQWAAALVASDVPAVALPLIDIAPVTFNWQSDSQSAKPYDACVFVSQSAVMGFFQTHTVASLQGARCLVSGLGTRAALIQIGLAASQIDAPDAVSAQFDSETLWQKVAGADWQGKRVCVIRGSNYLGEPEGRPWLAEQLQQAGASVDFVTTYQRRLPQLSEASRQILQHPQELDVWVFSSSQAIEHLKLLVPTANWSQSRAIVTHERIFMSAKGAGFGLVAITRPVLADVIVALKAPTVLNWR